MRAAAMAARPPAGELLRRIGRLAAPTTLVVALQVIGRLAETWLAARQGTAALAAWAVILPFALLMQMASAGDGAGRAFSGGGAGDHGLWCDHSVVGAAWRVVQAGIGGDRKLQL